MAKHEVVVGDRTIRIEDFSARKGLRVLRLLEHTANGVPAIQKRWGEYTREYEDTHTVDLDRTAARAQYPPRPLMREEPVIDEDNNVRTDALGRPMVRREPVLGPDGEVLVGPDPLGHITDADWAASNNKLRQPRSPSFAEQVVAILPLAIELAEDEVSKMLGLIAMPNGDVRRHGREGLDALWDKAAELGDEILDAPMDQVIELAVVAGESVEETYRLKVVDRLGGRLTAIAKLFGISIPTPDEIGNETSSTEASTTNQTSSTDSPLPTDGESDEPLTAPASADYAPSPSA
jgi:hypothetical protein